MKIFVINDYYIDGASTFHGIIFCFNLYYKNTSLLFAKTACLLDFAPGGVKHSFLLDGQFKLDNVFLEKKIKLFINSHQMKFKSCKR